MNYWKKLFVIHRIDDNLNRKGTGTADEFAEKMGMCRRNLFYYFEELRNFDCEVEFCSHRRSYVYKDDKRPNLPTLPKFDSKKIQGGENIFAFSPSVQYFCTPTDDLCSRLTNTDKQNDASGFRFLGFND
jgi:hypothetical protein